MEETNEMQTSEVVRIIKALEKLEITDEQIKTFILYVESGEEEYYNKLNSNPSI